MRDTTKRLAVTTWHQSHLLTRMGRNAPPAIFNAEEYEAAQLVAEQRVEEFGQARSRVMGDYYSRLSADEAKRVIDADFPQDRKRMGLKPKDVGMALLAHAHEIALKNEST
jgi:hypothetical protein